MELCYRGTFYQSEQLTVPTQKRDRPIIGKYRGVALKLNSSTPAASSQAPQKLTYRGVTYFR
ncbi:DUF4278 domain-containing protein [Phormidesmis sp. 146-35]